jgi:hypothetical protein
MLYTEQRMFDRFVPIAKEMGSREWERITTMSEMAEEHGRHDLAVAVYEACLGPGMQEDFLRKKYRQLKKRLRSSPTAHHAGKDESQTNSDVGNGEP